MARAGLARRTALGAATLMIGANFPDIDVLAVPLDRGIEWRRGWTHGVLAHVVLPFVLTGLMLAWDRLVRRRRGRESLEPADPRAILLLAALSIWTHPLLDWMNTYGMRWLMPFSGRWFYVDVLFIIDPWMWLALILGVILAGRARRDRPARIALGVVGIYVLAMLSASLAARAITRSELVRLGVPPDAKLMVGPVAVTPFRRQVVADGGEYWLTGEFTWLPSPRLSMSQPIPKGSAHPLAARAASTPEAQRFLQWARFPFYEVRPAPAGTFVRIADARYARRAVGSWAERTIFLPFEPIATPTPTRAP